MLAVRHSKSQNYSTLFNTRTGFFARIEDPGYPEPFWSESGPEIIDVAITNWCDRGCAVCYRSSHAAGEHMPFEAYLTILRQAVGAGVMQVALGGGNPNQHPDFAELLRVTRVDFGIVPSYTTNGRGLSASVLDASAQHCGAVAVSAYEPYSDTWRAVRSLVNAGIKTNIHFVLDAWTVDTAIAWMRDPPLELAGVNAIVFLNLKPAGRTSAGRGMLRSSPLVAEFFQLACSHDHPFRVGFDSCLVSGLVTHCRVDPAWFDACEAARFSMFISEKSIAYPCSFMEPIEVGEQITDTNLQEIWQRSRLFNMLRSTLLSSRCAGCPSTKLCMGGCPVYPEINLCPTDP